MRIATWNINSVRLRISNVLRFLIEQNIDVICLQETKTLDEYFPRKEFAEIGFVNQYFRGEKSYNGVAILSKDDFKEVKHINWCGRNDTRHIYVKLTSNIELHNFYVPAGGDEPDTSKNPKKDEEQSDKDSEDNQINSDVNLNQNAFKNPTGLANELQFDPSKISN